MHGVRRTKTVGQGAAHARDRERAHQLLRMLISIQQSHNLHEGSGGHAVRQGHAAHVRLNQVFNVYAGIHECLAHGLLCRFAATFLTCGNGGATAEHLGEGVIGFEHHVLCLLQQGCRFDRGDFNCFRGGGAALREGEAQTGLLAGGVECIHECLLGGNRRIIRAYRVACGGLARHRVRFERNRVNMRDLAGRHVRVIPAGVHAGAGEEGAVKVDGQRRGRLLALKKRLHGQLGEGGQACASDNLLRVGGARTEQGVAACHEVQSGGVAGYAGAQARLQVRVVVEREQGQHLKSGGGHARGVGVGGVQVGGCGGCLNAGQVAVHAGDEQAVLRVGAVREERGEGGT